MQTSTASTAKVVDLADVRAERQRRAEAPRIRVVLFVSSFHIGGTERQAIATAKGLDRRRFDVRMACFHREGPLQFELTDVPCEKFTLRSLYRPGTLAEMLRFARWLRRHRVDVLHAMNFYPNVFAVPAARLAGVPVVLASIRDQGDLWTPLQRRAQGLTCRLAHRVVGNAEAVRRRLVGEGVDPSRIVVIPNGVRCDGRAPHRAVLQQEFGVAPGVPVVGVVARLTPVKGVDHFIEAAALVAPKFPAARFVVVGGAQNADPAYGRRLKRRASDLGLDGRIVFTGFRTDVQALLRGMTISVMPSLSEGLSNVILESMAAGLPVVATRTGGNPELVADGITGFLVPPADAGALAASIERLLARPRMASQFGEQARRRAVERFSLEAMVESTGSLYRELLEARTESRKEDG